MFPQTKVAVIPSLIITPDNNTLSIVKEDKVIINGNFASMYGGFQSYVVASEFECPIFAPSMHCKRTGEEAIPNLTHLPYMNWTEWINHISSYKYAISLMPMVAAGTFSLNCAHQSVPCIGNEKVDTQKMLFPELSIDVNDIHHARFLAIQLKNNKNFYEHISYYAKTKAMDSWHVDNKKWKEHITRVLENV
jgi:methylthioribose-1-phosphate isomerase